jgi:N-acetylmuramoyl-L-alanine amidase
VTRLSRAARQRGRAAVLLGAIGSLLVACGQVSPPAPPIEASPLPGRATPAAGPAGQAPSSTVGPIIEPTANGSTDAADAAVVVAIDPGHGGCLDWGVPDPAQRGPDYAEKAMTLAIAQRLADLLRAEGIGVLLTREEDEALAGDHAPELGCHGPPFRDVTGDGELGFEQTGRVRGRDELQARLDLANLARADLLLSIHINSITENGIAYPIAATESFYTDETPWGMERTAPLAEALQAGVVAALDRVAGYEREDRGVRAHNLFLVAPPLWEPSDARPDPRAQPTRGALMPSVLTEVGSITRPEEHELLLSPTGQQAAAEGLADGIRDGLADRGPAARLATADDGSGAWQPPVPAAGSGPPFWAPSLALPEPAAARLPLRLTNSGSRPWSDATALLVGWQRSDDPYLRAPPEATERVALDLPPLARGARVEVELALEVPAGGRHIAWITLGDERGAFTDLGSPALQVANRGP